MKRQQRRDIWLLLGSLVALSCLLGFLFTDPDVQAQGEQTKTVLEPLSADELLDRLAPLIDSGSMQAVARSLYPVNEEIRAKILANLLSPKSNRIHTESKRELIFDLAMHSNPSQKMALFSFLVPLESREPVLYAAVKSSYKDIVPYLLKWMKSQPTFVDGPLKSLEYAIDTRRLDIFNTLVANGVIITKGEAQDLIWRVIEKKSKPVFLSLLLKYGATLHTVRKGRTPLIRAVEKNDEELVSMILQLGASINAMADPIVGTSLQRAIELHHKSIELLLREKGARE